MTTVPFLLSRAGVPVDRIANVSALAMSPLSWSFVLAPLIDSGLTRRAYAYLLAMISASSLGLSLWLFSPDHLTRFALLLMMAVLTVALQNTAVAGWTSEFCVDTERGRVGGWVNVANLGGGAIGSMLIMSLATRLSAAALGIIMVGLVAGATIALIWFPPAATSANRLSEIVGATIRSVVRTSFERDSITGFVLFLAPVSCVAATNLFAGIGDDFHVSAERVVLVNGAGAGALGALGAIFGGWLAGRNRRTHLYLAGGALAGVCSLLMAVAPHTAMTYTVGVLAYNAIAGVCYAAITALSLELVGNGNPIAATQLALFSSAINAAVAYMTWFDGRGYHIGGIAGMFVIDGGSSLLAAVLLFEFVRRRVRRKVAAQPVAFQNA
jgi:MFS family permease